MALQLLCHLRDRKSRLQAYVQLLPAPAASVLKSICVHGPDATDLLLWR